MEIGALFILVILIAVVGAIGGGVFMIAAKRRRAELDPHAAETTGERAEHPRHLEVESEQKTRFVGTR